MRSLDEEQTSVAEVSSGVSEAAPELPERIWVFLREGSGAWHTMPLKDSDIPYARVHQPPEQNSEDKNSGEPKPTAPCFSSTAIPKDSLLSASDSRFRIVGQAKRKGDLFLLLEDVEGQYIFTQRTDDAEQWAVFSECMVGSITARDVAAFVQNTQATKSSEASHNPKLNLDGPASPSESELVRMLALRKELDPDAPAAIVFPKSESVHQPNVQAEDVWRLANEIASRIWEKRVYFRSVHKTPAVAIGEMAAIIEAGIKPASPVQANEVSKEDQV